MNLNKTPKAQEEVDTVNIKDLNIVYAMHLDKFT